MLPESLQKNLKQFEKRLFVVESIVFVCGGLLGVLVSFLLLFVSDRFWDTPAPVRVVMTLAGCVVFASAAVWWSRYWLLNRRDSKQLAKLVQRGMSGIGDRLLGAVELAEGENLPENVSPALCQAAIDQVAAEMKRHEFKKAVEAKRSRVLSLGMLLCAVLVAGLVVFVPSAFWNSLTRWGKPISSVPRYTFVSIEDLPAVMVVPHGEAFEMSITLTDSTAWRPEKAVCVFAEQPEIQAEIVGGVAEFAIPGQVKDCDLTFRLGDIRRTMRVTPVFRPELVAMRAEVEMPAYLGYSNYVRKVDAGTCEVVEDSKLRLIGSASRELESVVFRMGAEKSAVSVDGAVFSTEYLDSSAASNCVFAWQDKYGLQSRQPYTVRCLEVKDMPPVVECRGIGRSIAILEDEVVKIEAVADDDYGLRDLRLNWTVGAEGERVTEEELLSEGNRQARNLSGSYLFSPMANNVPEESIVTVYASARDYRPGVKPELSVPHRIYVLSRATHAKMIQEMMERVQNRIEDLIREEEGLKTDNEALAEMDPEQLKSREGSEKTRKNEYTEREHARKLQDIAREMEDLMKELMRNSEIDSEAAKNWAEMTEAMKSLSKDEMQKAVQSMREASGDPSKREENLKEAVAMEEEIVEQLKKNAGKMGKTLEDMMARNFVGRLRQLAQMQSEVGDMAKAILPKSVGLARADLPPEIEKLIAAQETKQSQIKKEAGYIYDDIGGYYNRTRREIYDTIRKDMAEKKTPAELEKLKGRIADNLGVSVIQGAGEWADQFKAWAKMLSKDSGGGGEGDGEPEQLSEKDMQVLIELLRLRQGEEALREQTRLLEERKEGNIRYGSDTRKLAKRQGELGTATLGLQRRVKNKKLKQLLEMVDGEMLNAEVYLKRPQTDHETVAIETQIIELISDSITQSGGAGQGSAASMMLMQMMGMGSGGGSMAGGTTDKENIPIEGDLAEQPYESRTVDAVGGVDETWSEEFKDALEAYHKALEKE